MNLRNRCFEASGQNAYSLTLKDLTGFNPPQVPPKIVNCLTALSSHVLHWET
jgi:hypothetical protein